MLEWVELVCFLSPYVARRLLCTCYDDHLKEENTVQRFKDDCNSPDSMVPGVVVFLEKLPQKIVSFPFLV